MADHAAEIENCPSPQDIKQAAIKHFRHFCEGRVFQLWTEQKPLVTDLSRVSVPISPTQQCHLVFISESNVQLLYLPGLKNVLPIFYPAHPHSPLDQSPPQQRQIQWILKRWPPSKTAVRKCSFCWAAHPSNWLSARQAFNAWLMTFPPSFSTQSSPYSSEKIFLTISMTLLTLGG
jgi:hypothetical protein